MELLTIKTTSHSGAEVTIAFGHEYPGRDNPPAQYDPNPRYYATIHLPDEGYVPKGKKIETKGYVRVTWNPERDNPKYQLGYGGGIIWRSAGYSAGDLPDGYVSAIQTEFAELIRDQFENHIAARAREGDSVRLQAKSDEAIELATAFRLAATNAVTGGFYATVDEIEHAHKYGQLKRLIAKMWR